MPLPTWSRSNSSRLDMSMLSASADISASARRSTFSCQRADNIEAGLLHRVARHLICWGARAHNAPWTSMVGNLCARAASLWLSRSWLLTTVHVANRSCTRACGRQFTEQMTAVDTSEFCNFVVGATRKKAQSAWCDLPLWCGSGGEQQIPT